MSATVKSVVSTIVTPVTSTTITRVMSSTMTSVSSTIVPSKLHQPSANYFEIYQKLGLFYGVLGELCIKRVD